MNQLPLNHKPRQSGSRNATPGTHSVVHYATGGQAPFSQTLTQGAQTLTSQANASLAQQAAITGHLLAEKQLTFDELLLKQYTTQQSLVPQHQPLVAQPSFEAHDTIKLMVQQQRLQ